MSFGITELMVILAIVLLLFGTKKLSNMGNDLGSAIKGFKNAMSSENETKASAEPKVLEADDVNSESVNSAEEKVEKT